MPTRIARVGSVLIVGSGKQKAVKAGGRNIQSVSMIRSLRFGGVGPAGLLGLRLLGSVSTVSFLRGPTERGDYLGSKNCLVVRFCGALLGLLYLLGLAERPNGKDRQRLLYRWP